MKNIKFYADFMHYVYGALLTFILLLIPDLFFANQSDIFVSIARACFAMAIPFLSLCLLMVFLKKYNPPTLKKGWYERWEKFHPVMMSLAFYSSLIGVFCVFAHASIYFGLLFIISTTISLFVLHKVAD